MEKNKNIILYLKDLLPDNYKIIDCSPKLAIRCVSNIGLNFNDNCDDKEHWYYIENAIKWFLQKDFLEIYFNTNTMYKDFVIYYKKSETL